MIPRLDPNEYRHVIGHFASGIAIITTHAEGRDHGMTASAVTSLSMDPPMLLVCLNTRAPTQAAVASAGAFTVNILAAGQDELAKKFAQPQSEKFAGVEVMRGMLGQPGLVDVLAQLECRIVKDIIGGTHRVFLAEVISATSRLGDPLLYYRGRFGNFQALLDEAAKEELAATNARGAT